MIANDEDARVFLTGSIFGGTGASGFPTIARLVKDELDKTNAGERATLGGALVLPYFHFLTENDSELQAKSEAFLMNTQAALRYYYNWSRTDIYKAVYLFGDEARTEVEPRLGGPQQRNAPHFIELYAALAAIDFFKSEFEANQPTHYYITARHQEHLLLWNDLPDGSEGQTIESKVGNLARFSFAFLSVYEPILQDIRKRGKGYRAPWYIDFFQHESIELSDNHTQTVLNNIEEYCCAFLLWLANIQENCGEKATIELIKSRAYVTEGEDKTLELKPSSGFELHDFGNLIRHLNPTKPDPHALNTLWERISAPSHRDSEANEIGQFINTLYHYCQN